MRHRAAALGRCLLAVWISAFAARAEDPSVFFQPGLELLTGYDDRPTGATESWYSEAGVTFQLKNRPAKLDLFASGSLHQRFNRLFESPEDYRYNLAAGIGSSSGRLQWLISPSLQQSLSANSTYNTETGELPDEYLRDGAVTRRQVSGTVSYRLPVNGGTKTELIPYYSGSHIDEERSGGDEARRQHEAGVRTLYRYSERTGFTVEGAVQLQSGSREKGRTSRIAVGSQWHYSEKTSFSGSLGWTVAEYDESGSAQSPYFNLRGQWQTTEKVSAYLFGGNAFRPGIEGRGAQLNWRLGYGADWRPTDSLSASIQLLHQIEQPLGEATGEESQTSDFLTIGLQKKINKQLAAFSRMRYKWTSNEGNGSKIQAQLGIRVNF